MLIQSLSFSPLNSPFHSLWVSAQWGVACLRHPFSAFSRRTFKRGCVAAGIVAAASLLCLSLSLPMKIIIPSDLLGGIHPASMDMLVASAHHSFGAVH